MIVLEWVKEAFRTRKAANQCEEKAAASARWRYTNLAIVAREAARQGLEVQVKVGPRQVWVEAAPVQIIDGRPMRYEAERA